MFTSELKRLFKNKLAIIVIFVLLGSIGAHLATIFYSPQNQLYKQQLAQPNTTESTAQVPYLSQQIEIYDNYKQDLRATIDNNEKKLDMEIFKDSTLRQSILNENKVLRNLSEIDIKLEKTYAISNVLTSPFIAVVCLILVLFLINSLFVEDLSSNAIMLFKSTQTSNKKHFTTKLLVLISIVTVFMILVFALILMFCMMEGLNLNSPIQLVKEYRFYSQLLSILGALALQMIQVTFTVLLIGVVGIALILIIRNQSIAYGMLLLFMLIQYLIYNLISITSPLAALKYFNLYHLGFTGLNVIGDTYLFGWSIQYPILLLGALVLIFVIVSLLSRTTYAHLGTQPLNRNKKGFTLKSASLKIQEFFRIFVFSKGFLILLLLFAYSFNRYQTYTVSKSEAQKAYEVIESRYYGEITQEKIASLKALVEQTTESRNKLDACTENESCDSYSDEQLKQLVQDANNNYNLSTVYNELLGAYNNGATIFSNADGYEYAIGPESTFSSFIHLLLVSSAITLFVGMNTRSEIQNNLPVLLDATPKGSRIKQQIDSVYFYTFTLLATLIVYGLFILKLQKGYPIYHSNIPLQATRVSDAPISLYSYTVLSFGMHLGVYMTFVNLIKKLSKHLELVLLLVVSLIISITCIGLYLISPMLSPLLLLTIQLLEHPLSSLFWTLLLIGINLLLLRRRTSSVSRSK